MNINEMTLEEIQARRAEIVERRSAIDAELETAESEALQALETEVEGLNEEERSMNEREAAINAAYEARKAEEQEVLKHATEIQERKNEMENIEVRNTKEYIDAYAEYLKSGDDRECRALLSENATNGTVAVPTFAEDAVRTAWEKDGITRLVKKTYLKGNLKVGFEISGTDAVVHTESANSAVDPEDLVLGIVNISPKNIKKWLPISDEALDLKGEEFLQYIYDELTYRIAKKLADEIVADIDACGTVSTTTCPGQPKITSTTVTLGLVAQAMATLSDDAANPVVILNKATWGEFKAAQAAGSYGYDPFEGLQVVFNNSMKAFSAATTGDTYAIVGDLGVGAQANFPKGEDIEIKFDDTTLMEKDLVRILGKLYVAHGVVAPNAFCRIAK